jgi:hypothetical protein
LQHYSGETGLSYFSQMFIISFLQFVSAVRVASARNVDVNRVRELIAAHTEPPTFGFLGKARVNVLELNLALDGDLRRTRAWSTPNLQLPSPKNGVESSELVVGHWELE